MPPRRRAIAKTVGWGLAFLCVLLPAFPCHADGTQLDTATQLEQSGDVAGALDAFRAAFAELEPSPAYFSAYDGLFRLETNVANLISASRALIAKTQSTPLPAGLAGRIAGLFEVCGMEEDALAVYRRDVADNKDADSLDAAVRLCVEMNDTATATQLVTSSGGDISTLAALEAIQRGDMTRSADANLLADQRVILAATPGRILGDGPPAGTTPSGGLSVQVGSYTVKANADDMMSELRKHGFTPTLGQETFSGVLHYRVFAARSVNADQAKALVTQLSGQGFSGLIVVDK